MKLRFALGPIVALVIACGAGSQVPKTAQDTTQCVQDVIADVNGAVDVVKSAMDCGMAVADFVKIVETWIDNNTADASASAAASPKMARALKLREAGRAYLAQHSK